MKQDVPLSRFVIEQVVAAAIVNAAINGVAPWLFFRWVQVDPVPLYGQFSIAGDTIVTAFLLPFLVSFGLTITTHRKMRCGLQLKESIRVALIRSLLWGGVCMVVASPVIIVPLHGVQVGPVELYTFSVAKAVVAGLFAAAMAPVVIAMAVRPPGAETA